MSEGIDTMAFRQSARKALQQASAVLGAETVASLFGDVLALCSEVERYREGAQTRTLQEAARLAEYERTLPADLPADERLAATMAHTGFKRGKVYYLRRIARRSILNRNSSLNRTGDI